MCLIVVAWRAHAEHDLLVAANRDEFHVRPTEPAHWWSEPAGLFAGRDVRAGGAWCGAGRDGRFAAVTNVRDPDAPAGDRSRGALVRDYFAGAESAHDWARRAQETGSEYGPFNLLVADADALWFVSNRDAAPPRSIRPGVLAVSNGHWGEHWPKTDAAERRMRAALTADTLAADQLLGLLADTDPAPREALPATGVDAETERFLSPLFIRSPRYGTRAATVVARTPDKRMCCLEQGFDPAGQAVHRVHDTWPIETRST